MDIEYPDSESSNKVRRPRKRCRRISSSSDNENEQCNNFINEEYVWKAENHTPIIHRFTSEGGATINTRGLSRGEVFELFFNTELITKIIAETNKYGASDADFIPIEGDELKVFIAVNILMSLISKPTVQSYWSTDKSIETPYFKNVMSRGRFISISKNLHFSSTHNPNNPLSKIREVMEIVKKTFIYMYVPNKNISIDESLMACRSRLHYIQFIRTKRARFGIKFYKVCDSQSRYIHNFNIYIGKDKTATGSAGRNVVFNLLKESQLLHKGYCLFIDNWYSSPKLFRELYKMKTNVCGTVRINRKEMPRELKSHVLQQGEATIFTTKEMVAIKWKDKKDVVMLTTMHDLSFVEAGKQNRYTGQKTLNPTAVVDYNQYMGGVDVGDQMLSKFHTVRRCKKAYKKMFFYFIDMMLLNTYVIFKNQKKDRAFHVFKQLLAEEIIDKYLPNINVDKASVNDSFTRFTGRHFPVRIPAIPAKGNKTSKRCVLCLSKSIRRETVFKCHICDKALCIDHFKEFHER
ncbi:PREDICTED: piggyBac transposable element-derived protein 4-like [Polistes canadensis]|uniref:piggyBac transposable element-derived protein 4-like n=1 Tax=Polistes canadensis TaxID=91411 RepID=UPI000718BA35|nr:PREDICTED: piggyBac transposable element-derived protein 4-like [Polistes canadensis]